MLADVSRRTARSIGTAVAAKRNLLLGAILEDGKIAG
jgi:hypothetical protein